MREPNAVDFWRGLALVTIFMNHIPGNTFERYTYSQYGISDAAELFVFLAGWSIGIATRNRDGSPEPRLKTVLRLLSRTIEVYRAQITTMALALGMIAGTALVLDNPLLLEWHNAGGFFADPIQTMVGFVLLTHQLGFFNILPLYVVLLGIAPVFVLIARLSRTRRAGAVLRALRARASSSNGTCRPGRGRGTGSSTRCAGSSSSSSASSMQDWSRDLALARSAGRIGSCHWGSSSC